VDDRLDCGEGDGGGLRSVAFALAFVTLFLQTTHMHRSFFIIGLYLAFRIAAFGGPRDVAAHAFPSVVMLVTQDSHGQPLCIGSGFFVKENVIASNAHVVEDAAGGYAKLVGQDRKFDLKGIVAIDTRHDVVLLAIEGSKCPLLTLADSASVRVGDRVYSVGNPKGLEGTFAEGIISGVRDVAGEKLLQITAPISPGSSGGPILDESGAVVGIAVATYKGGQNLNFAIPISQVTNLMSALAPPTPLASKKQDTKQKNYVNDLGEESVRGVEMNGFLWDRVGGVTSIEFVFRNRLAQPVTNIKALLIFHDAQGEPCDFEVVKWPNRANDNPIIPAGLAKSSFALVSPGTAKRSNGSKPEVRILGFEIVEDVNQ